MEGRFCMQQTAASTTDLLNGLKAHLCEFHFEATDLTDPALESYRDFYKLKLRREIRRWKSALEFAKSVDIELPSISTVRLPPRKVWVSCTATTIMWESLTMR